MRFTSPMPRVDPPLIATEREALTGWLDYHRAELLSKLEGLDAEQAARRVLPSLTTLHGLLRHLTKVEHAWFVHVLSGSDEPGPFGFPQVRTGDPDFTLGDDADLTADLEGYLAAVDRSRKIFATLDLDDTGTHQRIGTVDVRWVMIHMIEEYAQHNGHADIIRELIDGTTQS